VNDDRDERGSRMKTNLTLAVLALIGLAMMVHGCGGNNRPLMPGTRLIYEGVYSMCDRGNRVYLAEKGGAVVVIPGGCPDGNP
jgi:hypothetical protein